MGDMVPFRTKRRVIIAVNGEMLAGKDTFADAFLEYVGPNHPDVLFTKVGFSDAIIREFSAISGIPIAEVYERKNELRPLIQEHGAHRRREDPDYWIKYVLNTPGNIVISGLRYMRERMAIVAQRESSDAVILVRVEASLEERKKRGEVKDDPYGGEAELRNPDLYWDTILENNKTLDEFRWLSYLYSRFVMSELRREHILPYREDQV